MALTFTARQIPQPVAGSFPSSLIGVTLDASYPAGGWPISAREVGLPGGDIVILIPGPVHAGILFVFDTITQTLRAYSGALVELTTGSAAAAGTTLVLLCFGQ